MGSVYLATDPAIGQQVAVKVIRTDLDSYTSSSSAQVALQRFKQEARSVANLDHLHILPLYRYGEEETPQGKRAYMIMQYRPEDRSGTGCAAVRIWLPVRCSPRRLSYPPVYP